VGNNTFLGGDAPTFLPYPMNLDGVTVSFDVPGSYDGKPADYNGAPGFFTFVGQAGTQLNVMVPWELQGATSALVKVTVDGIVDSNVLTLPLGDICAPIVPERRNCGGDRCDDIWGSSGADLGVESGARGGLGAVVWERIGAGEQSACELGLCRLSIRCRRLRARVQ
jgi:hypothetical protein